MKLLTEDNGDNTPTDDYLALLVFLWRTGTSVNLNVGTQELRVYPVPDEPLAQWIQKWFNKLIHWLPGECDSCKHWVLERTECFWGAHPHLCPTCSIWAVSTFEAKGKWPEPIWYEREFGVVGED